MWPLPSATAVEGEGAWGRGGGGGPGVEVEAEGSSRARGGAGGEGGGVCRPRAPAEGVGWVGGGGPRRWLRAGPKAFFAAGVPPPRVETRGGAGRPAARPAEDEDVAVGQGAHPRAGPRVL